jgi:hypothetical protein
MLFCFRSRVEPAGMLLKCLHSAPTSVSFAAACIRVIQRKGNINGTKELPEVCSICIDVEFLVWVRLFSHTTGCENCRGNRRDMRYRIFLDLPACIFHNSSQGLQIILVLAVDVVRLG